jgi:hypothetical protein
LLLLSQAYQSNFTDARDKAFYSKIEGIVDAACLVCHVYMNIFLLRSFSTAAPLRSVSLLTVVTGDAAFA